MNDFLENLKREATANPTMTIVAVSGLLAAASKFIEAAGHHKGSAAYAKYAKLAEKKAKEAAAKK